MHVQGTSRDQICLFPERLDDYVTADNSVRIIDRLVESLDLKALGYCKVEPKATGRPAYHPATLLKLYLYGYLNRIRSSRRLEAECHRNVEVMWLVQQLRPDFKTIADFRKDNAAALQSTFQAFTTLCCQAGLFGKELVAIDGSLFHGVNSRDRVQVASQLKRQLSAIDSDIERYLKELDRNDAEEDELEQGSARPEDVAALLEKLKQRRNQTLEDLQDLVDKQETQRSLTDPDSRLISHRRKPSVVGYNTQIAVDARHKLVATYAVTNAINDKSQLAPMSTKTLSALNTDALEVVADAGYYDGEQIEAASNAGVTVYVPSINTSSNHANGRYGKDRFRYDAKADCYHCPAGERLVHVGHYPKTKGRYCDHYQTRACRDCTLRARCTSAKYGRKIYRMEYEPALESLRQRNREKPERQHQRKGLVEHPFGSLKRNWGYDHFLMKGKTKVNAEMGLMLLAYNMKRVHNLLGENTIDKLGL